MRTIAISSTPLAFAFAMLLAPAAGAQTVWSLASGYSDTTFQTINLRQFAADVDHATAGKLRIEVHSNGSLAPMAQIVAKVEAGTVPAGEVIMTAMAQQIPIADVDTIPFIVASYDDARRLWKAERPVLDGALAKHGLVALYAVAWPPQGLYAAQPVHALAELKGTRMRTYNAATLQLAQNLAL